MANPGSILGQIGESFEQIGQDVARETAQAPKDLVGKAMETVGLGSGKKKKQSQTAAPQTDAAESPDAQQKAQVAEDVKRAIARAALEEISGKNRPQQQEPGVWEKIQKEEEEKKQLEQKKKAEAAKQSLPQAASKRPRGDLFGKKAKKTQVENKNLRQD